MVINQLGTRTCPNTLHNSWKSSKKLIFFPRTSRTYSNQLHSFSQKALSTLGSPPYLPKRARANFFFPIDPPQRVIITSILISTVLSLDSNLGQKLSTASFHLSHQKIRRNFDRLGEPASIRYPARMNRGGENRWTVAFGDGLHGVSTTETPRRSHTLRNQSFHCPCRAHIPQPAL